MNLTLKIWRQKNHSDKGGFKEYKVTDISKDMSFLEMFDVLNEQLTERGRRSCSF
jgi:succinate dehydrogenase / fumarate reductase, iron-sulfur subunit